MRFSNLKSACPPVIKLTDCELVYRMIRRQTNSRSVSSPIADFEKVRLERLSTITSIVCWLCPRTGWPRVGLYGRRRKWGRRWVKGHAVVTGSTRATYGERWVGLGSDLRRRGCARCTCTARRRTAWWRRRWASWRLPRWWQSCAGSRAAPRCRRGTTACLESGDRSRRSRSEPCDLRGPRGRRGLCETPAWSTAPTLRRDLPLWTCPGCIRHTRQDTVDNISGSTDADR